MYRELGGTGFTVSRLCFGCLTLGPLQANLPLEEGAALIRQAWERGVNFFDTAESYMTYSYLKEAFRANPSAPVIATKSYAYSREAMRRSLESALKGLGRDRVEIFLFHEQESSLTIKGHREALEFLLEAKARGLVGAVGISSHYPGAVAYAAGMPEIDVIHPLINMAGLGIRGGGLPEMLEAVRRAHLAGKGVYAMKALGGGHLLDRAEEALAFVRDLECVDSVAVGIRSAAELEMDLLVLSGRAVPEELKLRVRAWEKRLLIEEDCTGCGECVAACPAGALSIREGRAAVVRGRCVLCGYCGGRCPGFFIKIV